MAPVRHMLWTSAVLLGLGSGAMAQDSCALSETVICPKLAPVFQIGCIRHVQKVVADCRRARSPERLYSHEEHCTIACRAGAGAYELSVRLMSDAIQTATQSAEDDKTWLANAVSHWKATLEVPGACDRERFDTAVKTCARYCRREARHRDQRELKGEAGDLGFLPLAQPDFACPAGSAAQRLSRPHEDVADFLYAPGHARRSGDPVE